MLYHPVHAVIACISKKLKLGFLQFVFFGAFRG